MAISVGQTAASGATYGAYGEDNPDDLPRTFRREKEARAKEAREREARERAEAPSLPSGNVAPTAPRPKIYPEVDTGPSIGEMPFPASVRNINVPFTHLMLFFLKAVIAAIPALLLLGLILWLFGAALNVLLPGLFKMKILIGFGN